MITRKGIFQHSKVLIVGHGPSYKDYDFIRDFDGLILSVDATTPDLLDNDIIPNYTIYSETQHTVRHNMYQFLPERCVEHPIRGVLKAVYRTDMTPPLISYLGRLKMESIIYDTIDMPVGLYAISFADSMDAREIHLIGYDYKGVDNDGVDMTDEWKEVTKIYLSHRNGCIIIDHSGGDFPI